MPASHVTTRAGGWFALSPNINCLEKKEGKDNPTRVNQKTLADTLLPKEATFEINTFSPKGWKRRRGRATGKKKVSNSSYENELEGKEAGETMQ